MAGGPNSPPPTLFEVADAGLTWPVSCRTLSFPVPMAELYTVGTVCCLGRGFGAALWLGEVVGDSLGEKAGDLELCGESSRVVDWRKIYSMSSELENLKEC